WLIANQGHWPYPFAAPLLDIHGFEWGIQQAAPIARALAYHKPVVSLPLIDEHYQEPFIRDHVRFAFIPGGYATREFAERAGLRELYRKYVPAILACVTTGWEPVTYARTDNDAVKVERFGQPPGRILLSVVNTTGQPQRATLTADAKALRLPLRPLAVRTLVSGQDVNWRPRGDAMVCRLLLEPHQADVVALAE
ncbi:MAG: hypothetical protein H5T86_08045, partial [Armatimonadetes bacterium]|nr:hypothetical protein [Armatimonadota bacterium]